jgi:hypothetical protein
MSKEDFSQPYTPQERQAMRAIEKEMAPLIFPRKLKRKDKRTGKYERTGFAENSSQFAKFKKLSAKHAAIGSERIAPKTPDTIERLANDAKHLLSGGLQMHRAIAGETDASKQSMAGVVQAMYDRAYRLDTSSPARPVAVLMTFAETKGAIEQLQRWCIAAISKPLASNAKPDKEFLKNFGDELRAIAIAAGARKTPARKQQPERSRPMSKRQIAKELSIPVKKLDAMTEQGHYKMWKLSRKTFQIRVDKLAPEQRLALL